MKEIREQKRGLMKLPLVHHSSKKVPSMTDTNYYSISCFNVTISFPKKDIYFSLIIFISLAVGPAFQRISSPFFKQTASISVSIVLVTLGAHCKWTETVLILLYSVLNAVIIKLLVGSGQTKKVVLVGDFLVITLLRAFFSLTEVISAQSNLILMLMTLRAVDISYELEDPDKAKEKINSFIDILGYLLCHCGFVVGPFFEYNVYCDWLTMNTEECNRHNLQEQTLQICTQRSKKIIFYLSLAGLGCLLPSDKLLGAKDIHEKSYFYLILIAFTSFYTYRGRLYVGFIAGELICMLSWMGAYPEARGSKPGRGPPRSQEDRAVAEEFEPEENIPTDGETTVDGRVKYDYLAVTTCNDVRAELCGSLRVALRCWNQGVQYWLAKHIYKPLAGFPKPCRVGIVFFVSALWHGVSFGYIASFSALFTLLSLENALDGYVNSICNCRFGTIALWLFKLIILSYFGASYYLLDFRRTIHYWSAVNWWGHKTMAALILFAAMIEL